MFRLANSREMSLGGDLEMATYTITMRSEQRVMMPDGLWTEWHPLNLLNMSEGLEEGQRFQRRLNGKPTSVMIYRNGPGPFPVDESVELSALSAD